VLTGSGTVSGGDAGSADLFDTTCVDAVEPATTATGSGVDIGGFAITGTSTLMGTAVGWGNLEVGTLVTFVSPTVVFPTGVYSVD
jgi:hypothetical protein